LYSQKLFGFLKSWDDKPEITISVSELHEMLDTPESSRQNFAELRRYILEKAHKDITAHTSLRYEWEPIKQGRSVVSVRFIFARRRALPMVAKKADDAREKQSQDNTRLGVAAISCFKAQGNQCSKEKPRTKLCKFCLEHRDILA
ncbi:MAG: replication initiation protein, partial [Cloacibacillus sp.]